MKIEFLDNNTDLFGNLLLGDIFERDNKLFIKVDYCNNKSYVNAFDLMNNKPTRFTSDTTVTLNNNFILKEV